MTSPRRWNTALAVQCTCTALVALGAAYASYRHGQHFALRFGADVTTASIWPLIVDGLLTMATVELWKPSRGPSERRWTAWAAFGFGISLSLCANVSSAPEMSVPALAVAACPPLALLLAVELLNRALKRHRAERADALSTADLPNADAPDESNVRQHEAEPHGHPATAEERMWAHYETEFAKGHIPSGAELDRIAGTHNYGRRILRRWRAAGRAPQLHNHSAGSRKGGETVRAYDAEARRPR